MATPFKLKSGNASAFKNLGSSPAKQVKGNMPKNWNTKGSSGAGELIKSKVDIARAAKVKTQNFRNAANKIKTVSSKTNIGNKVVDLVAKKPASTLNRTAKTFQNIPKQYAKVAKKGLGKIVKKSVGRLAGGPVAALAGMAYGAYKSAQKHSGGKAVKGQKSFMADAKKKTKSIYKKKSPAKQKDHPARTGGLTFEGLKKTGKKVVKRTKKLVKEVTMPVSQQVKRNEERRLKDFDRRMKLSMTPSEKAAYNRKYPNEKIK